MRASRFILEILLIERPRKSMPERAWFGLPPYYLRRMRPGTLPAVTLAILLAGGAAFAQAPDVETGGGVPAIQTADATKKEKDRFLAMLDDVETLARWMTNEPGFVSVLDDVRQRVLDAKGSDLAPLDVYGTHYAALEDAFSRIRGRMSRVQSGPELC